MADVPRRQFLGQVTVGGAALLSAGDAVAASPYAVLLQKATDLRQGWLINAREIEDSLLAQRPGGRIEALQHTLHSVSHALSAFHIYKELESLTVEEQTHPAVQHLFRDALRAIGHGLLASKELVAGYLEEADPKHDASVRTALEGVRYGLRDWKATVGRQSQVESQLKDLESKVDAGELRLHAQMHVKHVERLERIARSIAEAPDRSGLLNSVDPSLKQRVEAGLSQWESYEPPLVDDSSANAARDAALILAAIGLGFVSLMGVYVVLIGICLIACTTVTAGILTVLLGLTIIALAAWGILVISRILSRPRTRTFPDGQTPLPTAMLRRSIVVRPDVGWIPTGIYRKTGQRISVVAQGLFQSNQNWGGDADGNGVVAGTEAFLPGAPEGALIGRIGTQLFFLGSERVVPDGEEGQLELGLNLVPMEVDGFVNAWVEVRPID